MPFEKEVLKSIISKAVTVEYPKQPLEESTVLRGRPEWTSEKCIGCKRCANDCPASAIIVEGKKGAVVWEIDYGACVFCGQCERSCPTKAIKLSHTLEYPTPTRSSMKWQGRQQATPQDNIDK